MPKIKTHSGAAKRFKITKKGKILRARAFGNHILEKKSSDRKRDDSKKANVSEADKRNIKKLLGN